MPRRKSVPRRKRLTSYLKEKAASQSETDCVSSRCDGASATTVGEQCSVLDDGPRCRKRCGRRDWISVNSETLAVTTNGPSLDETGRHNSLPEEESAGEHSETTLNGRLSNTLLKRHPRSRQSGTAASKKVSLVKSACEQSESVVMETRHGKRLQAMPDEGSFKKESKFASNLDDPLLAVLPMVPTTSVKSEGRELLREQPVVMPVKKRRRRRITPRWIRRASRITSKVKPGTQQAVSSPKVIYGTKQPNTSEQTCTVLPANVNQSCSKRSKPSLTEERTREHAGRETRSKRKRKADLVETSCSQQPENDLERSTYRSQPGPAKKGRTQKAKTNMADQGKIAGKVRVTEWQLTNRITSQWGPISTQAINLILDLIQLSTG